MAKRPTFSWKRFWCIWDGNYGLTSEGYLYDPDSDLFGNSYPDMVSFESISNVQCLVLLGEPGVGKTSALRHEADLIYPKIASEGGEILEVDLNSITSTNDLSEDLFNNPVFKSWENSDYNLHIFLDSLDECLLRIENLAAVFKKHLSNCPTERLNLRIACRTTDWLKRLLVLENTFKDIWGPENIKIYELLPLRRNDIIEAANTLGINSKEFINEIEQQEAVPLANRPITLMLLLNEYQKNKQVLHNKLKLYYQGIKFLCKESNEDRIASGKIGTLTSDQLMLTAARIAAMTLFSKKDIINLRSCFIEEDSSEINIPSLCGGKEQIGETELSITETAVNEVLNISSLFNSRGEKGIGWAHETYAEFLAAWYLYHYKFPISQIKSLIYHPCGKIVPQLQGVVGWLCIMFKDLFNDILLTDPEVLLFSDLSIIDEKGHAALAEALLDLCEKNRLIDHPNTHLLKKLDYPGIAEQLKIHIIDKRKKFVTRQVAMSIANACNLQSLQEDILNVALDGSEDLIIRGWAAGTLINLGDDIVKAKLKPLAISLPESDPYDELKGYSLLAIWPNNISAQELFTILTPPRRPEVLGSYFDFLYYLGGNLKKEDIPFALKWVAEHGYNPHNIVLEDLINSILIKSCIYLESPEVLQPFAKAIFSRLRDNPRIIEDKSEIENFNEDIRKKILCAIVPLSDNPNRDASAIAYSEPPLILREDIPWLIGRLYESQTDLTQKMWSELIERIFDYKAMVDYSELVLKTYKDVRMYIFKDVFYDILGSVELGSTQSEKLKEHYLRRKELEEKRLERKKGAESLSLADIPKILIDFNAGDYDAWWTITYILSLDQNGSGKSLLESNITEFPGWASLDSILKPEIIKASKSYLLNTEPDSAQWVGFNEINYRSVAGYRALRLLLIEDPQFLSTLSDKMWSKWAPVVLAIPDNDVHQEDLISIAYSHAANEIINTLNILIEKERKEFDCLFILHKVEDIWGKDLEKFLLYKSKDQSLRLEHREDLLRILLCHDSKEIRPFTESFIISPPPTIGEERQEAISLARVLFSYARDAAWQVIWPAIKGDLNFGEEVILSIELKYGLRQLNILDRLTEYQLADLFIWLIKHYPIIEDPTELGGHFVTHRENISNWRDSILISLSERGTPESIEAISNIIENLPGLDDVKWIYEKALKSYRNESWEPLKPEYILKLVKDSNIRLIESGEQLLNVIIESLSRLEGKLQGEIPASRDIWDFDRKHKLYRPIYEEELSDYIVRHLLNDIGERGIILGREVKIHRGEKTDIYIHAIKKSSQIPETIKAIVEVKGCWNKELDISMQAQLKDHYLNNNNKCNHGLYIVGWFNCDLWDPNDYRYNDARASQNLDIEGIRDKYNAQAISLSDEHSMIKSYVLNCKLYNPKRL